MPMRSTYLESDHGDVRRGSGPMMLIFCPNLAVDHLIDIDRIALGHVQHARRGSLSAGGKGLNVARAARHLEVRSCVVGLVGGAIGQLLKSLLAKEALWVESPPLDLNTRIATIVLDRATGVTTVFNEPGPRIAPGDWAAMTDLVTAHLPGASVLVCTGSLLPGVPEEGYVDLIETGKLMNIPVIVDAAAETLRQSAESGPTIIKVNLAEAESALGIRTLSSANKPCDRALRAAGLLSAVSDSIAVVTIAEGAALAGREERSFFRAPSVRVRNDVGAGDAFLAGLAEGVLRHSDISTACQRAVAVGTASVESNQPGWFDPGRAHELESLVVKEPRR